MRETVTVEKSLIKEAMDALAEKTAELTKMAALVAELSVYKRVAELVSKGAIDPADTLDKVAEFQAEPDKLLLFEKRSDLQWGACIRVDESSSNSVASQDSPEEQFYNNLKAIL